MGLIEDLTPKFYELTSMGIQRSNGNVLAIAYMRILNADGRQLMAYSPFTTLTPQEKQVLAGFVNRELTAFENATGLQEWTDD